MVPEKTINFQSAHQFQAEPWTTEILYLLNPHLIDIDFHPFRLDIIEQFALDTTTPFGSILNTHATGLVHFTKPSHDPLPRSSFGPVGLDQCPVMVLFAIFCACQFSYIHTGIIDNQETKSTGQVVTTFGSWHLEKIALAITTTYLWSDSERGSKNVKKTSNCGSWAKGSEADRNAQSFGGANEYARHIGT
jgi:hypothetical protein